jgi:hypothetical protein
MLWPKRLGCIATQLHPSRAARLRTRPITFSRNFPTILKRGLGMSDPDFPATAPDHAQLRRDVACEGGLTYLDACATVSPEGAAWAAWQFLDSQSAGIPWVPMVLDLVRSDAQQWAEMAAPDELQAYAVAAMDRLAPGPFTSRQIKRLVAALWRRMSPEEQSAFKAWINK